MRSLPGPARRPTLATMSIWTLHYTGRRSRTIAATAAGAAAARADALRTIADLNAATGFDQPRYTLTIDGELAAILHTGIDAHGLPDHHGIAALLDRI